MSTEQEPTVTVKLLQLLLLSTYWGMQIWVTFISSRLRDGQPPEQTHLRLHPESPRPLLPPPGFGLRLLQPHHLRRASPQRHAGRQRSLPDLHLIRVGDGGRHQRAVVRPDDVGPHGGHAPGGAGVRTGSGHRPVVQPRGLRQAERDRRQVPGPQRPAASLPPAVLALQPVLHRLQLQQPLLHGGEPQRAVRPSGRAAFRPLAPPRGS